MQNRFALLIFVLLLVLQPTMAASPVAILKNRQPPFHGSLQASSVNSKTIRPTILAKLRKAVAAKLLRRQLRHAADQKSKNTLSLISLIAGVLGLACLASVVLVPAGLLLAPTAIITGIVALHHNNDKGARTQAIIGLIAGALPVLFIIIAVILFASAVFPLNNF